MPRALPLRCAIALLGRADPLGQQERFGAGSVPEAQPPHPHRRHLHRGFGKGHVLLSTGTFSLVLVVVGRGGGLWLFHQYRPGVFDPPLERRWGILSRVLNPIHPTEFACWPAGEQATVKQAAQPPVSSPRTLSSSSRGSRHTLAHRCFEPISSETENVAALLGI